MSRKHYLALAISTAIAMAGCSQAPEETNTAETESAAQTEVADTAPQAAPEIGSWGFDLTGMNTEVHPGNDFNKYANGQWLDTKEIPSDRARWGIFDKLRERSTEQVNVIIDDLERTEAAPGTLEHKVGSYYSTWMNVEQINAKGIAPLQPLLDPIAAIEDHAGVLDQMASLHTSSPFGLGILPDPADTTRYTIFASQAGLGLPDRDYYLNEEARFANYREAYADYIEQIFTLAGIEGGEAKAAAIIALETQLAQSHWTRAESRDIKKIYNPMSPDKLAEMAPELDWKKVLANLGLQDMQSIIVAQPSALQAAAKIFKETDVEVWKDYMTFHMISDNASYLSSDFDDARFNFFSNTLRGIAEQRERSRRGSDLVNANLGEAVGKIYVDKHFGMAAKNEMDKLVKNLTVAFEQRIKDNAWMDDETKQEALGKLSTFEPKVGFTNKWTNYDSLEIVEGDMVGNTIRMREFGWLRQLEELKGPVDRERWPYPPQTVNASYNPLMNQITFPAGILQPPFFDLHADPAINYGAIGGVIGHEIGHGFDDQGRRFDQNGKIRDWWSAASDENFKLRSDKLVAQYDQYSPIEGMNVNGRLALGENIGDLGGLEMAYAAYQLYVKENGEPPVIDGFTGTQRFFLAWAQVWRGKMREDAMRQQLTTGPHSPPQYRINGVVRNMDAWYDAFGISEEHELYLPPEERVSIW
ncbi:MAG: M13 family metallopeptidase [Gammaproteobacteria bacterium]